MKPNNDDVCSLLNKMKAKEKLILTNDMNVLISDIPTYKQKTISIMKRLNGAHTALRKP